MPLTSASGYGGVGKRQMRAPVRALKAYAALSVLEAPMTMTLVPSVSWPKEASDQEPASPWLSGGSPKWS